LPRRLFMPLIFSRPPHIHLAPTDYSWAQLAKWILSPAPEPVLRELYRKGLLSANNWIDLNNFETDYPNLDTVRTEENI